MSMDPVMTTFNYFLRIRKIFGQKTLENHTSSATVYKSRFTTTV